MNSLVDFSMDANSQEILFDEKYPELYDLLVDLAGLWYDQKSSRDTEEQIIAYLDSVYDEAVLSEAYYIIDTFGGELTSDDVATVEQNLGNGSYSRRHGSRLRSIFRGHVDKVAKYLEDNQGVSRKDFIDYYTKELVRLAVSETHIAVESASVFGGRLVQAVTGERILKTWNSLMDEHTCPICASLNGTTVGVEEAFSSDEFSDSLDYVGGDITYAHPRCRCWVTYSKA